jgi:hypothetical protein
MPGLLRARWPPIFPAERERGRVPRRSIYELLIAFEAGASLTLDERVRVNDDWYHPHSGNVFEWMRGRRRVTLNDPNALDLDNRDLAKRIIGLGKQCSRVHGWVDRATAGKPSRETLELLFVVNLLLERTTELAARLVGWQERRRVASRQGGRTSAQSRRTRGADEAKRLRATIEKRRQTKPASLKATITAHLRDTRPDWLTLTDLERQRAIEATARRLRRKNADPK